MKSVYRYLCSRCELVCSNSGEFMTDTVEFDGGRKVTVYIPLTPPEAIVFAGDGQRIAKWGICLEKTAMRSTMIVGVHSLPDESRPLPAYHRGLNPGAVG